MADSIPQSEGTTPSERYLARLANRTFLSVWSHPNLYRDQGGGKELCDLLVVFGQNAIVFSDKECAFPQSGNARLDWQRWFRRSVLEGCREIFGAERWLKTHPTRVFLDQKCARPFPWPPSQVTRFHRVVVARGATAVRERVTGVGSLTLDPRIQGSGHTDPNCTPFVVGHVDPTRGFVHVLDDVGLDVVLREMDTALDFLRYLADREAALTSGRFDKIEGEENLLAYYLWSSLEHGQIGFWVPQDPAPVEIPRGLWEQMRAHPAYARKKAADEVSYVWDGVIETFAADLRAGILIGERDPVGAERALRAMAEPPRSHRRELGRSVLHKIEETIPHGSNLNGRLLAFNDDSRGLGYAFVVYAGEAGGRYEDYRRDRREALRRYCLSLRARVPRLRVLVGLATEPKGAPRRSWDIEYVEFSDDHRLPLELADGLKLRRDVTLRHETGDMWPGPSAPM